MPKKSVAVDDAAGRYALSLDAIGAPIGSKIAYAPLPNEKEGLAKLLGVEKTAPEVEREHVFAIENAPLLPHRPPLPTPPQEAPRRPSAPEAAREAASLASSSRPN